MSSSASGACEYSSGGSTGFTMCGGWYDPPDEPAAAERLDSLLAREETVTLSSLRERGYNGKVLHKFTKGFLAIRDRHDELQALDREHEEARSEIKDDIDSSLANIRSALAKYLNEPLSLYRRIWRRIWRK